MMVSVFERGRGSHRGGVSLVPLRVLALAAAFFLCAPLAALASTSTGGKSMTVSLTTPWTSGTTLLHEAAELLDTFDGERSGDRDRDRDRANLVWKFVDAWVKQDTTTSGEGDDRTCFARVLETAEGIVTPTQVKFLKAGLLAREASPKAALFERLADQTVAAAGGDASRLGCCSIQVGRQIFDDWRDAASKLQSGQLDEFLAAHEDSPNFLRSHLVGEDHVRSSNEGVTAILNAALGSDCHAALHPLLSEQGGWTYAWRPVVPSSCLRGGDLGSCGGLGADTKVAVAGFGVELAIKNMEYKAVDDSAVELSEAERDSENQAASIGAVRGFLFDTLLKRGEGNETVRREVLAFKDALEKREREENSAGSGELRAWHLDYMGLQAAQRILSAKDPLSAMGDISTAFPALANSLSKLVASPKLKAEVNRLQKRYGNALPELPELFVNGLRVDKEQVHLHTMLAFFRTEMSLTRDLALASGLTSKQASRAIAQARPELSGGAGESEEDGAKGDSTAESLRRSLAPHTRVCSALDDAGVQWMNDIEKDRRYDGISSHLQNLFPVNYFGMLMESGTLVPQYRKNLFHLVAFLDVSNPLSGNVCEGLREILDSGEAVRLGVVAYSQSDLQSGGGARDGDDGSAALARAFQVVRKAAGAKAACSLLRDVAAHSDTGKGALASAGKKYAKKLKRDHSKALESTWTGNAPQPDSKATGYLEQAVERARGAAGLAEASGMASGDGVALTVNGIFASDSATLALSWRSAGHNFAGFGEFFFREVQPYLKEEVERARDLYRQQRISQDQDALPELVRTDSCVPRFNAALFSRVLALAEDPGAVAQQDSESDPGSSIGSVDFSEPGTAAHGALFDPSLRWVEAAGRNGPNIAEESGDSSKGVVGGYVAVVGDGDAGYRTFCSAAGHLASKAARGARHAASGIGAAVSFVPNPAGATTPLHGFVRAVSESVASDADAVTAFAEACEAHDSAEALDAALRSGEVHAEMTETVGESSSEVPAGLGLSPGSSAIVSSSLVVPVTGASSQADLQADLLLLDVVFSRALFGAAIAEAVGAAEAGSEGSEGAPSAMAASSFLLGALHGGRGRANPRLVKEDAYTEHAAGVVKEITSKCKRSCVRFDLGGGADKSAESWGGEGGHVDIVLIVDPLSKFAQRASPLLSFLGNAFSGTLTLVLWPKFGFEDLPLKTYYAYAAPEWPDMASLSAWPPRTAARFTSLPATTTLSTQLDTPQAWLTGATAASLDLDNLKLEDLGSGATTLHAEFEIESLIVSGSCIDQTAMAQRAWQDVYPTGLRLMMGERRGKGEGEGDAVATALPPSRLVDTSVMKNHGYFQLKASPGVFDLGLVPGCSEDMFAFAGGKSSQGITVTGFDGLGDLELQVERRGNGGADVMKCEIEAAERAEDGDGEEEERGVEERPRTSWLSRLWGRGIGGSQLQSGRPKDKTLNIFSVASGHLYERFLRIMILSVLKNTKSNVKFWLIKNYMSPKLKRVLPEMAEQYGFEYELITYKWPSWVLRQTEKQRIIWAYKILFLDVIFPVSLDRVIYVDADQVVRSDLMELQQMDIKNRVYAYTPFCDNDKEMDGFRFWKQGFWKSHLRGRNYHISALYLVDLKQFRMRGAGDQLRVLYNGLAKDPNSLANLDQDLPNYAQDLVPIFSLPQEWLYCETWCGKKTKHKAKTIDLCNNPMTKEPKLVGAKRIVPEWTSLDEEQRRFVEGLETKRQGAQQRREGDGEGKEEL